MLYFTGIVASIIRGKDVEIQLKYLQTEYSKAPPCWNGTAICDKVLNCVIWCHDKIRHCGYNLWKFIYWGWVILRLIILVVVIYMAYVLVDGIVSVDFIISLGTFDLLTVGLAAQRSIRNEVICTTALAYNNYTLGLLSDSRETYAKEKNEQAWDFNVDELERVDVCFLYILHSALCFSGLKHFKITTHDYQPALRTSDRDT